MNQSLGYERFTIAHEIYHILQNRVYIKEKSVIEEMVDHEVEDYKNNNELMADSFAAELLIPEKSLKDNVKEVTNSKIKDMGNDIVIQLQHKYGVDYIAMTRRLKEVGIINDQQKNQLEEILGMDGKLQTLTKKLGRSNDLNTPSKDSYILQKNLEVLKANYENGNTTFDDLVRIFGYLGSTPEKFGYDE
ncbi:MAG TPA: hypothetical protein DIW41_04100 [Lachnospiraceae bacterium]|nr:hypothetical protein [Lachnospiraceae bacterium]